MIKRFLKNISYFLLINFTIIALLLLYIDKRDNRQNFKQSETESVLYSIPENQTYDLIIMGSSHGRMFTRGKNHSNVEKLLNKKIVNISKSAAGNVPEFEFLKYFNKRGNKAREIWYFIDPFIFYSSKWNEELYFLTDEPFRFDFFLQILMSGLSTDVKYNYIKSKFMGDWLEFGASRVPDTETKLTSVDSSAVLKRVNSEYPSGLQKKIFIKYARKFDQLISYANKNNIKITFIIPPTLLNNIPGMTEMKSFLSDLKKNYKVNFYDFSEVIKKPEFYYNHDHLNNDGVDYFTKRFLAHIQNTSLYNH